MKYFNFQNNIFDSNLPPAARLLALTIASHQNSKTGAAAFPSIKTLVAKTGLSKATIYRMKKILVSEGYISEKRRYNASNEYLMMRPDILTVIPEKSHDEELIENRIENIIEKKKESDFQSSSLVDFNYIQQEDIEPSFEVVRDSMSAAEADKFMSW